MSKLLVILIFALNSQKGEALKCYNCNGESWCKDQELLLETDCSANAPQTYTVLSRHYGISYTESSTNPKYQCFSIDSTLNTIANTENQLVYKGCVEKGFEACDLVYNHRKFVNETKEHCKVCSKPLCNKNDSSVNFNGALFVGLSTMLVRMLVV